jgi:hypothetical protein
MSNHNTPSRSPSPSDGARAVDIIASWLAIYGLLNFAFSEVNLMVLATDWVWWQYSLGTIYTIFMLFLAFWLIFRGVHP